MADFQVSLDDLMRRLEENCAAEKLNFEQQCNELPDTVLDLWMTDVANDLKDL